MHPRLAPALTAVLAALLLPVGAAAQAVHVVGPVAGSGIDFTSLPSATAAAADGDVVLVLPGAYAGLANVTGKSLSVVAVGTPRPQIETLAVKNLGADQTVLVRGFASGATPGLASALLVLNCSGAVLVEDCVLDLQSGAEGGGDDSTTVNDSSHVVFSRCVLTGARGPAVIGGSVNGSPGVRISNSTVTLDACTVTGGVGHDGFPYPSTFVHEPSSAGGEGILLLSGAVTVRGCDVTGGQGGDGQLDPSNPFCLAPSNGGDAIRASGLVRRMDSTLTGGAAGAPECDVAASTGAELNLLSGSVAELAGQPARLELTAVIEDGGTASLSVQGTPGDVILLLHALGGSGLWLGGLKGTLVPAVPSITLVLGPVPPGGESSVDFVLPPVLPAGIDSVLLVNQPLLLPPAGKGVLGSASSSVLVFDAP